MEADLAYLAGLFDGEGTVAVYETTVGTKAGNPRPAFLYQVQIANTHWPVIQWILDKVGGTWARKTKAKAHHRQGYVWRLTGQKAADFMELIRPYCIIKASQIDKALAFRRHLTPRNIRQTEDMLATRRALAAEIKEAKRA
jgi:hypothetical protein